MFSSYHRTYQLFGCVFLHWPENIDQSGSWDVMKDRYGDKFTSSWIGALQDTLEYYNLFKEASKHNLKSIWLYQLEDTSDQYTDINLSKFCEAAWENGYLKKINEKMNYKFICSEDSCNCDKSDKNAWRFLSKNSLKIYQEVERQIND